MINRRGFLAVLFGVPIAARLEPTTILSNRGVFDMIGRVTATEAQLKFANELAWSGYERHLLKHGLHPLTVPNWNRR